MFEEELGYILMDFKKENLNYREATLKIEQLIMKSLQFSCYVDHLSNEIMEDCKVRAADGGNT